MHLEYVAKFNVAGGPLVTPTTNQNRPFRFSPRLLTRDRQPAIQNGQFLLRLDTTELNAGSVAVWCETRHRGGNHRVIEHRDLRRHDKNRFAAQAIGHQISKGLAVIDIKPFGRGDKTADISRLGKFESLQKEMQMQACQLTAGMAKFAQLFRIPMFPFRGDIMMSDIRRVADEERYATDGRYRYFTIVGNDGL